MSHAVPSVLIVGPAWVGDMVMAQSLFRLLKQGFPDIAIDVVAPAWSQPLLSRMAEVRDAIEMPLGHGQFRPWRRYGMGKALRAHQYDWAIVLPYTWKAALLPFAAKIPRRTGYVGEARWGLLNDLRRLDKKKLPMMVQRYAALAMDGVIPTPQEIPKPQLDYTEQGVAATLCKLGLARPSGSLLVLCPGAEYGPAKCWPAEHFAQLAQIKIAEGYRVWILGSEKDRSIGEQIIGQLADHCVNLTGKTTLEEAIDLMSLADVVVTNDSGLMHIAAALNRRVIAIYGSSDTTYTPPLTDTAQLISLRLDCSPCFKRTCPYGHYDCLNKLTVDRVLDAF